MERCDRALEALRQRRPHTHFSSLRHQLLSTSGSGRGRSAPNLFAKKRKCAWKHKFMCLGYCGQARLPCSETERNDLFEAGLGEKEIEFESLSCSPNAFQDIIFTAFPQLRDAGGYQFLKCVPNSRNLEVLSSLVLSSPLMLKQRVGAARTYIRPLQRDLDLTKKMTVSPTNEVYTHDGKYTTMFSSYYSYSRNV